MKRTGKMESIAIRTGRLSNAYDHFNRLDTEEDLRKENITISIALPASRCLWKAAR